MPLIRDASAAEMIRARPERELAMTTDMDLETGCGKGVDDRGFEFKWGVSSRVTYGTPLTRKALRAERLSFAHFPRRLGIVYFVYILYCPVTNLSYVGQTDNLILRYYRHRDGKSRWTRRMHNPMVVHWELYASRSLAMKREKQLKSGQGFAERQRIVQRFIDADTDRSVG